MKKILLVALMCLGGGQNIYAEVLDSRESVESNVESAIDSPESSGKSIESAIWT